MTPDDFDRLTRLKLLTVAYAWGVCVGWVARGLHRR